jgi:hypothetical protein
MSGYFQPAIAIGLELAGPLRYADFISSDPKRLQYR